MNANTLFKKTPQKSQTWFPCKYEYGLFSDVELHNDILQVSLTG